MKFGTQRLEREVWRAKFWSQGLGRKVLSTNFWHNVSAREALRVKISLAEFDGKFPRSLQGKKQLALRNIQPRIPRLPAMLCDLAAKFASLCYWTSRQSSVEPEKTS